MKILLLSDYVENFNCLASFRIRYQMAAQLAHQGHDVTYMFPSYGSLRVDSRSEGASLKLVATPGLFPRKLRTGGFSLLDTLCKIFFALTGKYDIIHVTSGHRPGQLIPALLAKSMRSSIIVDEWWEWYGRGGYAEIRKGPLGRFLAYYDSILELSTKHFFDGIIAITGGLKNRLGKKAYHKAHVLHGGSETSALEPYSVTEARSRLDLPREWFIIGMSNLCEDDTGDNQMFLDAFGALADRYPRVRLLVTGERAYIDHFMADNRYSALMIYPGWVSFEQYNQYLSACDIFALPLRPIARNIGRWPNKIGDYLALERPVITNPTGDLTDFFTTYKIGVLCDTDKHAFYEAIEPLITGTADTRDLTLDSRYVATEILSFEKRVARISEMYRGLLERSI